MLHRVLLLCSNSLVIDMTFLAKKKFLSIGECMLEFSNDRAQGWNLAFAGDALNTAWYFRMAARMQDWEVSFLTRLGTDSYSDQIEAFLQKNSIETQWITRDPVRSPGLYLIETEQGERSFTYWRSQSAARLLAQDEAHLERAIISADVIYFSGITLAILATDRVSILLRLLAVQKALGKLIVFDPNIRPRLWADEATMRSTIMEAAGVATIVLPSFADEKTYFGDEDLSATAERYLTAGSDEVVVKNGGGPVLVATRLSSIIISDLATIVPLDTTGAGDSFNGAYLAARQARQSIQPSHEMEAAVRAAHARACEVVMHRGALLPMNITD